MVRDHEVASSILVIRTMITKGDISEAEILLALLKLGIDVSVPYGYTHRYDLVIDVGGKLFRVQCKTGRQKDGFVEATTSSLDNLSHIHKSYETDVDFIAIHCATTSEVYLVKPEKKFVIRLRTAATKNKQRKGIRFAGDYLLEDVLRGVAQSG